MNGILEGYDFPHAVAAPLGTDRASGQRVNFNTATLNRHGTLSGATGTGKSRTLQVMAEWLSERGIPVLLSDGKGDMSGLASAGEITEDMEPRLERINQDWWQPTYLPVEFIAPGGNGVGVPMHITVGSFGWKSLSKLVKLTEAQHGALGNSWGHIHNDSSRPTETLADLCAVMRGLRDDPDHSLTEAMCARVIDKLETFDRENPNLFGGPEFDIMDLLRKDDEGYGYVSIIDSSKLLDTPEVLTSSILWVMDQLNKHLPEVGDNEMKLVVMIDEAHTLFEDAPKEFIRQFRAKIKKLRSKGVGVLLCTQNLSDIPEDILTQCGLRIQHTVRVNTPKSRKALMANVETFPESSVYNIAREMTSMPKGRALVCIMDDEGIMTDPASADIFTPRTSMEPLSAEDVAAIVAESELTRKYARLQFEREERERQRTRALPPVFRPRSEPTDDVLWSAMERATEDAHNGPTTAENLGMDADDMEALEDYVSGASKRQSEWS